MDKQVYQYISGMPHFSFLPEADLKQIAESAVVKDYPTHTRLAVQNQTAIDRIYIVTRGALAVYEEKHGEKKLTGYIKPGDVFGGITILLNAGISLRTVIVDQDCSGYMVPKTIFEDLCRRHKPFFEYFLENFSKNIYDESLDSIIETGQARYFLSGVDPFSFLPEAELEHIISQLSVAHYPKDTVLFVQERSRLGYVYILQKGSAERYYEEDHKKTMRELLGEGDMYGGISILLNDGISVRTLRTTEKAYFYLLSKEKFLDVCSRNRAFSEYFTDIFGRRMLEKSYAAIMTKARQPRGEGSQFFNQSVVSIYTKNPVFGPSHMSVQEAARIMSEQKISSIFIKAPDGKCAGVVTERDLTRRVLAAGLDVARPVSEIMSSPVDTIAREALIFEVLMAMMQKDIRHMGVTDADGQVVGIVSNHDLLRAQGQSPLFLHREILDAASMQEIVEKQRELPALIQNLIANGAQAKNITRFITSVSDTILNKLIANTLEDLGPAPAPFAFMILGSEGRQEQTLKTDQDNAIVFEDITDKADPDVRDYFLKFGEKVCGLLDQAGYAFCKGGVMAKNPQWCQPLSTWKDYFSKWIHAAEAEDLLQASIFFDFRCGYGEARLIESLRRHLFDSLEGWSGFFRHLTENALHFKPPIGFFRNFVVESKGEHRNAFDIKQAMTPIVDFARIYALKNNIEKTNTLERLQQLSLKKALPPHEYEELEKAYSFLLQLRFARQVTAVIDEKAKPDNYINPKKLARIEQKMLKEIFLRTEKFQTKLEFDFIGIV